MMRTRRVSMVIAVLCLGFFCEISAMAQGGWDVWTIYLRDGTRIDAAPVWSLDENVLKYGMSGAVGEGKQLKRSLIASMRRNVAARQAMKNDTTAKIPPALTEGDVKEDLVVMGDGRRFSGTAIIRAAQKCSWRE